MGDNRTVVTEGTESLGRILVAQESGWVTADLNYRVRAIETSSINVDSDVVSYVNIWVIKMKIDSYSEYVGDLDLTARAGSLKTDPSVVYTVENPSVNDNCRIHVDFGNQSHEESLTLTGNKVVFNFIVSEVEITP